MLCLQQGWPGWGQSTLYSRTHILEYIFSCPHNVLDLLVLVSKCIRICTRVHLKLGCTHEYILSTLRVQLKQSLNKSWHYLYELKYFMVRLLCPVNNVEGGYRNSQRPSIFPSVHPSQMKVLSQPQFFTDPYQIYTACLYHWKIL